MKVVLTVLCRDEEDIIDAFCRFHLDKGIDHIVATDNGSVDNTRNILKKYANKGLVTLIDEPEHNHDQAIWVSRMAKLATTKLKADWIIHSDADEFWHPRTRNLKTALANIKSSVNALKVKRTNFLPPNHQSDPAQPFWQSMQIREHISLNSLGNPLPPKICHRAIDDAFIEDGNHQLSSISTPISYSDTKSIEILHFPIRSYWQLERKIRQGTKALECNSRIQKNIGETWRHLYWKHLKTYSLFEYYCNLRPDEICLQQRIAENTLIIDKRIQQHFSIDIARTMRQLRQFVSK